MRLVSQDTPDLEIAARRLLASGPAFGIDLSLLWGVPDAAGGVRQACLAVLGAGRTSMLFVSEPSRGGDPGGAELALAERTACVKAACSGLFEQFGARVQVAQALPDVREAWAIQAYKAAGLQSVGDLTYLRRAPASLHEPMLTLPRGLELVRHSKVPDADTRLLEALQASYEDTLDCPELCGLREPVDILDSHRATGKFDPNYWWLLLHEGQPAGCVLLNQCPEQRTVELVYIGLATSVRGKGLSRPLLAHAIREAARVHPDWAVTCAVDERNTPAKKLYERLGFHGFAHRTALVSRLDGALSSTSSQLGL